MSLLVKNAVKDFGGVRAVNYINFEIPKDSITGLIGPNGSGKTTLFNLLTGFLPLDKGEIWYKEQQIDGLKPHRIVERGIIRTFQITRIFPQLTVLENMLVPTRNNKLFHLLKGAKKREHLDKAHRLLESVGLAAYMNDPAISLSYGQSKLLEIALSFMVESEIILLDEPFAGINPALQEKINEWIKKENSQGKEFFIIEHNMDVIMNICHHIVVMNHGQKLAEGNPSLIQKNDKVLEAYLGD